MKVTVVVPTKNEARSVAETLKRAAKFADELMIVDGHSTDDTISIAKKAVPSVKIIRQEGFGKGAGIRESIPHITGDVAVFIDADGSHIPEDIPKLVREIEKGADMAIASRFMGGSDEMTPLRFIMNKLVNFTINMLWGTGYTDTQNGFRAIRSDLLRRMDLKGEKFEIETEMCIKAAKLRANVTEIPSHEFSRLHGVSNQSLLRHGPYHLSTVIRELFRK